MLNIELRELIRIIVRNEFEEVYGIACKVSDVREDDKRGWVCDCAPINESATLTNVRLQPSKDGQVLITPAEGSVVFVIKEDESNAFVSMYGQIDEIKVFDGTNGGVPIATNIADKLNVLEQRMFDHQHLSASPGSPTTPDPATNPIIPETQPEDLENPLFLH